jgi:lysyl endopeptidase
MQRIWRALVGFGFLASITLDAAAANNVQLPSQQFQLPALKAVAIKSVDAPDMKTVAITDAKNDTNKNVPYRFAIEQPISGLRFTSNNKSGGTWQTLADGRELWRFAISSKGAQTLSLAFKPFFLPHGAQLFLSNADGSFVLGPYDDQYNKPGEFWTPVVPGEVVYVEVAVPANLKTFLQIDTSEVLYGYRGFGPDGMPSLKSGSCNVDSICPAADGFREQIRAVAKYVIGGGACTGTLINTPSNNPNKLFISANHCFQTQAQANAMVVYWKFESPTCRVVGSAANGIGLSDLIAIAQPGGATLLAGYRQSDFSLVRLNTAIPSGVSPYFVGWDRRVIAQRPNAYVIHQPQGDEKRFSIANGPVQIPTDFSHIDNLSVTSLLDVLEVPNYAAGTTERGSSGSALLDPNKRVIGFLTGGGAACGNNSFDIYGSLSVGWNGGGTATTRLRDYLDPSNTGAEFIDGSDGSNVCPTIAVTLNASADPFAAGANANFSANATGGTGPYNYTWDLEGDGVADRTVAGDGNILTRYHSALSTNVSVTATDSRGCFGSATRAINVTAPDVRVSYGAAQQICGDSDAVIEPGERFRIPVTLTNSGSRNVQNGAAIFARPSSTGGNDLASDTFGYSVRDTASGSCAYNFVDIGNQIRLPITAVGANFPAYDDGAVRGIGLTTTGGNFSFDLYGQTVSSLTATTNGYILPGNTGTGADTRADCSGTPFADNSASRLSVLHQDMVMAETDSTAGIRAVAQAVCARQADVGAANQRCVIVQWNHLGVYVQSQPAVGDFDMQAIIYPDSKQIVYQYRGTMPDASSLGTIGTQNTPNKLVYSCKDAPRALPTNKAVCLFAPGNKPTSVVADALRLETPSVNLGNLAAGQSTSGFVNVAINPNSALCNSTAKVSYRGSVDELSYSGVANDASLSIGAAGNCNVSTNCPATSTPVPLKFGGYSDLLRPGTGLDIQTITRSNGDVFLSTPWYSAQANRNPFWTLLSGNIVDNQVGGDIAYVTRNINAPNFSVVNQSGGTKEITLLDSERVALTFEIGGKRGGEVLQYLYRGLNRPTPQYTGAWYPPSESGWGYTSNSFIPGDGSAARDFNIYYLYDAAGQPRWVLGSSNASPSGSVPITAYQSNCPFCAWLDVVPSAQSAGTVQRSYNANLKTGTISTAITLPAAITGNWQRSNLPIELILGPNL